ncbi:hypothetical protein GCM10028790_64380 [Micromonospora taraxaci]|uniref:Uncharacterized protein n=1 Tax=Micromonospora taraxaci TaxID=1316803 RepID=A0A561VXQ2_9ACTN|nr:FtsX-like permease family protein [Micromonospora taraxaci]TWG16397.1 hypothetical protein FHU34_111733 [Micromonospora taraxaci]
MQPSLILILAKRFARSRSLARSAIITFITAAALVSMFIAMKALTLSGEQVVERDLGRYAHQLDLSNFTSLKPGEDKFPEAVLQEMQRGGAEDALLSLTSFDVRPDLVDPPLVLYVEAPWQAKPFPARYALKQGRWPERAGEIVLTKSLQDAVGQAGTMSVFSGNERFQVVGVATDKFDSFPRILAATGTWRSMTEKTRSNFSTVSATASVYWNGSAESGMEAAQAVLASNGLIEKASSAEPDAQLAGALRSRVVELAQTRRSWVERIPLAYKVPSLALPFLAVAMVFGVSSRRSRKTFGVLTSIGMRRSSAALGVALGTLAWIMASTLVGAVVGIFLGMAVRPLVDLVLAGPISPFPSVLDPVARVLVVTGVSSALVVAALVVGTRQPSTARPSTMATNRMKAGTAADDSDAPRPSGRFGERAARVTQGRRVAILLVGFAVLAQVATLDTVPKTMILAGTFGLMLLLCAPEFVKAFIERMPVRGPRSRLGKRQLMHDKDRAVVGVAVLAAALGAPLGMLTLLATLIATAQADRIPEVAPGQVVLSSPAGEFHAPSAEVVDAVTSRVSFDAPPVRTGYLWSDEVKATVEGAGLGTVLVVESAGDAARLNNHPLTSSQVNVLQEGGMLVWDGEERGQRKLLLHEGESEDVTSTTKPLPTVRTNFQTPWDVSTGGLILTATARELGLNVQNAAVVFTGASAQQSAAAERAVIEAGLDPYQVGIYEAPQAVKVPTAFYTSAVGLTLIVLITTIVVARTQVDILKSYLGRLIAVGLSTRWVRQVLGLQTLALIAASSILAALVAIPPVLIAVLRMPDFALSIPWHWLGAVLLSFYGATAVATYLSSRRLRATDRLSV